MGKIGSLGSSGTQQLHREAGGWAWAGSIIQINHRAWWKLMENDFKAPRIWKGIKRGLRMEAGGTRAAEMNYKWLCWKTVSGYESVLLCCQWLWPRQLHTHSPTRAAAVWEEFYCLPNTCHRLQGRYLDYHPALSAAPICFLSPCLSFPLQM